MHIFNDSARFLSAGGERRKQYTRRTTERVRKNVKYKLFDQGKADIID